MAYILQNKMTWYTRDRSSALNIRALILVSLPEPFTLFKLWFENPERLNYLGKSVNYFEKMYDPKIRVSDLKLVL